MPGPYFNHHYQQWKRKEAIKHGLATSELIPTTEKAADEELLINKEIKALKRDAERYRYWRDAVRKGWNRFEFTGDTNEIVDAEIDRLMNMEGEG